MFQTLMASHLSQGKSGFGEKVMAIECASIEKKLNYRDNDQSEIQPERVQEQDALR